MDTKTCDIGFKCKPGFEKGFSIMLNTKTIKNAVICESCLEWMYTDLLNYRSRRQVNPDTSKTTVIAERI